MHGFILNTVIQSLQKVDGDILVPLDKEAMNVVDWYVTEWTGNIRRLLIIFEVFTSPSMIGSVPVDFLRPKLRVAHTKDDVISILMHNYTYTNMYIIKKIISCRFILCWDITSLFKPYEKSCRRRKVKIEKILTVTYRTLLTKTTNFLKSGGYKICLYLKIISYST